mgnify:CR=1 FL=1
MSFFISTPIRITQHRPCRGWVFEAHVGGWLTRVEPIGLNFGQELKMRLEGRKMYQILGTAEPILVERSAWHIARVTGTTIVLPEHRCSTPEMFEPATLYEKPILKEPKF